MRRLPPLGAMRAFEAAARLLSFTRAAAELCVTQAAISHQVRQLEQWLGRELFIRRGHALSLTHKGQAYLDELSLAFDRMAAATDHVRQRREGPLRITALPSFASRWLLPRLPAFREPIPISSSWCPARHDCGRAMMSSTWAYALAWAVGRV